MTRRAAVRDSVRTRERKVDRSASRRPLTDMARDKRPFEARPARAAGIAQSGLLFVCAVACSSGPQAVRDTPREASRCAEDAAENADARELFERKSVPAFDLYLPAESGRAFSRTLETRSSLRSKPASTVVVSAPSDFVSRARTARSTTASTKRAPWCATGSA